MSLRPVVLTVCILLMALGGCRGPSSAPADTRDILLVDTHIDVPYRLYRHDADVGQSTPDGDFDWPRARRGGLDVAFMSIYIPASVDAAGHGAELAHDLIDRVEALVDAWPQRFAMARSVADVERNHARGLLSLALGMENGGPLRTFADVTTFRERGIRYVTLAHSRSNHISDSSYDLNERWQGLSPYGRQLIAELNRQGIMVDVSHVSDRAFEQAVELSAVPVIASHSSARHFTPGFMRNPSDELIRKLAARGGVLQINFGSTFVTAEARRAANEASAAVTRFMRTEGIAPTDPRVTEFRRQWRTEHPFPYATLDDVLDHFDHVIGLVGVEHVGIGSDFDGVGDTLPVGLKDVSSYPNLLAGLRARGYDEDAIRAIAGGNLMRVWRTAEAWAARHGGVKPDVTKNR